MTKKQREEYVKKFLSDNLKVRDDFPNAFKRMDKDGKECSLFINKPSFIVSKEMFDPYLYSEYPSGEFRKVVDNSLNDAYERGYQESIAAYVDIDRMVRDARRKGYKCQKHLNCSHVFEIGSQTSNYFYFSLAMLHIGFKCIDDGKPAKVTLCTKRFKKSTAGHIVIETSLGVCKLLPYRTLYGFEKVNYYPFDAYTFKEEN